MLTWILAAAYAGGPVTVEAIPFLPSKTLPRRVERAPAYPEAALGEGWGRVTCRLTVRIKPSGAPADVGVADCPTVFHDALVSTVRRWRWDVPLVDGHPETVRTVLDLTLVPPGGAEGRTWVPTEEVVTDVDAHGASGEAWAASGEGARGIARRVRPAFPAGLQVAPPGTEVSCVVAVEVDADGRPQGLTTDAEACDDTVQSVALKAAGRWRWAAGEPTREEVRFVWVR